MIYSNFPMVLHAVNTKYGYGYMGAHIVLGNTDKYRENLNILCPVGITVEQGMNHNLNFAFSKSASLMIRRYDEDWRNFDDPRWNIPDELFLMLTSNIYDEKKPAAFKAKNGLLQTLERHVMSHFKMFSRLNPSVGRSGFYCLGIYKVLTEKPSIIRILPPGATAPAKILLLENNQVTEFNEDAPALRDILRELKLSDNLAKEDWVTI